MRNKPVCRQRFFKSTHWQLRRLPKILPTFRLLSINYYVETQSDGGAATGCTCPLSAQWKFKETRPDWSNCSEQNCPANTVATMTGATTETEGCTECELLAVSDGGTATRCSCPTGLYSDSATSCAIMNCPVNTIATEVSGGATNDTEGCTPCDQPQISPGEAAIECYCPPERTDQFQCAWKCEVGYYVANQDTGECLPMNCPENSQATSEQATQDTEDCQPCMNEQVSPGGSSTSCVDDTFSISGNSSNMLIIIIIVVVVILVLLAAAAAAQQFLVLSKADVTGDNKKIDYEVDEEKV